MKILCDKPGCKLTGNHDHLEVVVKPQEPVKSEEKRSEAKRSEANRSESPQVEAKPPVQEEKSLMGLLGDVFDECAGVAESFTGKPSSLRETAKKVRKVNQAGEKIGKLGQAVQESKLPALGKKVVQVIRDNSRMREYGK
jgi:hypothetical protein